MEIKTFVRITGLLLVILIQDSFAIKCYMCGKTSIGDSSSSSSGGECGDPFKKTGVTTMDCTGSCQKTKAEVNGVKVVTRMCWPVRMSEDCTSKGDVEMCYCNKELCNAAPTLKFSSIAFIAIVGVSLLSKLFI